MINIINDKISYIPCNTNPLSSDIGIIKDNNITWLFDTGNGIENIKDLNQEYNVIISHFHLDHIGNIKNLKIKEIYLSKESLKYVLKDLSPNTMIHLVTESITIGSLRIFPIVSSHAKGSLGLEVDNTYSFIGDATYAKVGNEKTYNAQLLKEEIITLKDISSKYLLLSHFSGLIKEKEEVINELEEIYNLREKNNPKIIVK